MLERNPESAAAAVRAIVKTQESLKKDVSRATEVGEKLFSPEEAVMIADVVERDIGKADVFFKGRRMAAPTFWIGIALHLS